MHIMETMEKGDGFKFAREAMEKSPFGPGFSQEQVDQADEMEVWGSSVTDPGEDFVEFRLKKDGKVIHKKRVGGY